MKRLILIFALILPTVICAQSQNWTYLLKGTSDSNKACYEVIELTLHEDQTFTSLTYGCGDRKEWKNYKKWRSKIVNGHTSNDGAYTILAEFRNGFKTENVWKIKVSERSVVYFGVNDKGQLKRIAKYKRTKLNQI